MGSLRRLLHRWSHLLLHVLDKGVEVQDRCPAAVLRQMMSLLVALKAGLKLGVGLLKLRNPLGIGLEVVLLFLGQVAVLLGLS